MNGAVVVWTDDNRARYDRRGQRYPSDLTDAEWIILEPLLPVAQGCGRPRVHLLREIMNGIRYVQRYGIPWDALPKDLPPHSICYDYWRLLTDRGHRGRGSPCRRNTASSRSEERRVGKECRSRWS